MSACVYATCVTNLVCLHHVFLCAFDVAMWLRAECVMFVGGKMIAIKHCMEQCIHR